MITIVQDNDVYKVYFHYDVNVVSIIKEVPGRRFDGVNKYWTVPKDRLGFLLDKFKGTPYEHLVDVYNNEYLSENATLDATTNIPNIDISDVDHYVEEGSNLFPHQLDFLKFAINKQNHNDFSGFILADQQGLGKTAEVLNLALYNRKRYGIKHCLIIVCLNSAKYNWVSEITKHTNGKEIPYILGSRVKRDGTINTNGSSADKLKDLTTGRMYSKKSGDVLPFFLIMNIESIRYKQRRQYPIREQLSFLCNNDYIGMIAIDEVHRNCFHYDTLIHTNVGQLKIGDIVNHRLPLNVLSYNNVTNTYEWKPIVNWIANTTSSELLELTIATVNGNKTLRCTPNHMFYTKNRGWVAAKDLTDADEILDFVEE